MLDCVRSSFRRSYFAQMTNLHFQFHHRRAAAAFVLRGFGYLSRRGDAAAADWRRALRRMPMPLPWTTRTRGSPARKARSTNFSTSRVASSTVWPMTLISTGAFCAFVFVAARRKCRGRGRLSPANRPRPARSQTLGDVVAGDFHFHCAHLHFEMIVVQLCARSRAARPVDFSFTVSPSETCFTTCGWAWGSP